MVRLSPITSQDKAQCKPGLTLGLRFTELVDCVAQVRNRLADVELPRVVSDAGQHIDGLERDERVAGRFECCRYAVENG
jgi:hypothetical protein